MKKSFILTLALTMALSLTAFSGKAEETANAFKESAKNEVAENITTEEKILIPYRDEVTGKYGYRTENGENVIGPEFDVAKAFADDGTAKVYIGSAWRFINEKGEIITGIHTDGKRDIF